MLQTYFTYRLCWRFTRCFIILKETCGYIFYSVYYYTFLCASFTPFFLLSPVFSTLFFRNIADELDYLTCFAYMAMLRLFFLLSILALKLSEVKPFVYLSLIFSLLHNHTFVKVIYIRV